MGSVDSYSEVADTAVDCHDAPVKTNMLTYCSTVPYTGHQDSNPRDDGPSPVLKYSKSGTLLEPQPSDDPHDPLNFPTWQKFFIMVILAYWAFLGTASLIIVGPSFPQLAENYHVSFTNLAYTINGPIMAYGIGCFFWVPLANVYGVRVTFLISSFGAASFSIWAALAPTFGQFVTSRVISAIFYSAPEAFGPQIVTDVFFLHQRATYTSIFSSFQFLGFSMAGLIGGFVTLNFGFHSPSWVMTGLTYGAFLGLAVTMPETSYTRAGQFNEGEKRTALHYYRLWPVSGGGVPKVTSKWHSFRYPWLYVPHPVVLLTTAFFSIYLATNDYLLTTNSISMPEVYQFGLVEISLTSLAPSIGVILGAFYGGYANDKYVAWRQRDGTPFYPEMRLPMLIVTAIMGPCGLAMFGAVTQYEKHWIAALIGQAMVNFGSIVAGNITYTYLADVYMERADAALVVINGLKNLSAFGLVYSATPWNTGSGYAISFGGLAIILFAFHTPMLVLYYSGQAIREWQAEKFTTGRRADHGKGFN